MKLNRNQPYFAVSTGKSTKILKWQDRIGKLLRLFHSFKYISTAFRHHPVHQFDQIGPLVGCGQLRGEGLDHLVHELLQ